MKRVQIVTLTAAALLVAAFVPATASAQSFEAGVKGGVNVATISYTNATAPSATSSRKGGIVGGFVAKDFNKKMGVQVEVLWSQKGGHLDFSQSGLVSTADVKLDYVEIPVLVRYNIPYQATVLHVYAGPVFAFSTKDELTLTNRNTTQVGGGTTTTGDAGAKSTDTGIAIGLQVDVHKFLVDVRYNWGLMDVNDNKAQNPGNAKNRCFSAMFGFRLK